MFVYGVTIWALYRQLTIRRLIRLRLLRRLVLNSLSLNAHFVALHVPGVHNSIADALSRFQGERFCELAPEAKQHGKALSPEFWKVVLA